MSKYDKNSNKDQRETTKKDASNNQNDSHKFGMGNIGCLEGWVNKNKKTD